MRFLLAAPLAALATCGVPTATEPADRQLPPCVGSIVERVGDEPLTCDIAPPQTLIVVNPTGDCATMGGTLYVSPWPERPTLCVDVDY